MWQPGLGSNRLLLGASRPGWLELGWPCPRLTSMKWKLLACLVVALLPGRSLAAQEASVPERLKLVCWNVLYGFNHGKAVEEGESWLRKQRPQVVALQELNGFTPATLQETGEAYGHSHSALQKESGFAMGLTSTAPIEVIERRVEGFHHGYLHARTHGIDFFVVHFWPGKEHEVDHVRERAVALAGGGARVVVLGDFNAHSERDASHHAGRAYEPGYYSLRSFEEAGFVDVVHRFDRAAWFSYPSPITIPKWSRDQAQVESKRQRIDFILTDAALSASVRAATVLHSDQLDAISDHYPVVAELVPAAKFVPTVEPGPQEPLFSFGAIADCQYCAGPARGVRRYSESPLKLQACVEHLNTLDLQHAVHLGDFIDREFESFDVVGPIYSALTCDAHHVLGNHDYSVADEYKALVPSRLGMPDRYHSFAAKGWRMVILDGNDVSLHSHAAGSEGHRLAQEYKQRHAPDAPDWNGAIGPEQLEWLEQVLTEADRAGERVILHCHFPVYPEDVHNLWNAGEVLELLQRHESVKAYLNGHNHAGNHAIAGGIHFLTLKGMVDTAYTSYAVIEVHPDKLVVQGYGREPDRILPLR